MVHAKTALIGGFTGVFLCLAWVIFIDGQVHTHDAFPAVHLLPPLFATFAAILMNLVSVEGVEASTKAKVWLFVWVTVLVVCIGSAIFILSTNYPIEDNYPGVALLISVMFVTFAGFLFFLGRGKASEHGF